MQMCRLWGHSGATKLTANYAVMKAPRLCDVVVEYTLIVVELRYGRQRRRWAGLDRRATSWAGLGERVFSSVFPSRYFAAGGSAKYYDERVGVSVCLTVCLSVCPLACLNNQTSKLHEIFNTYYSGPWLGPPLTTMEYIVYFRFCAWRYVLFRNVDFRLVN